MLRVTTVTSNEDEREIDNFPSSSSSSLTPPNEKTVTSSGATSSSACTSNSKLVDKFIGMGFIEKNVAKVIQENGEENTDSILNTILTYSTLETSPQEQQHIDSVNYSLDCDPAFWMISLMLTVILTIWKSQIPCLMRIINVYPQWVWGTQEMRLQ